MGRIKGSRGSTGKAAHVSGETMGILIAFVYWLPTYAGHPIQHAPNFRVKEFACKDVSCMEVIIDRSFAPLLQAFRNEVGQEVIITSGYRTEEYNRKIGGHPQSAHISVRAADILLPEDLVERDLFVYHAKKIFPVVKVYKKHIHCALNQ